METNRIENESMALQENTIDAQKERFEREMTEVLLNFREECLNLSRQKIAFGQPLDESGKFQNNLPDLSAVETIQPEIKKSEVEFSDVALPQNIAVENVSVTPVEIDSIASPSVSYSYDKPDVESESVEKIAISVPEVEYTKKSIEAVSLDVIPDVKLEEVKISTAEIENAQINAPAISIPDIEYKPENIEVAYCNVASVVLESATVELPEVSGVTIQTTSLEIPQISFFKPDVAHNTFEITEYSIPKPAKYEQKDVYHERIDFSGVVVPSVAINGIEVQTCEISLPAQYTIGDINFENKSEEIPCLDMEFPPLPTIDWD